MKRRELLFQTLVRVTGHPKNHISKVVDKFIESAPDGRWEEYLPLEEELKLVKAFEAEASGILALYVAVLQNDEELQENRVEMTQQENAKRNRRFRRR